MNRYYRAYAYHLPICGAGRTSREGRAVCAPQDDRARPLAGAHLGLAPETHGFNDPS